MNKHLEAVSVSSDVKVSMEATSGKVDKTKETVNTSFNSDDKVKVYPTPGTEVKVDPDGSIIFKADSIVSFTKRKTDQAREILKDIKENLHQNINVSAQKDSSDKKQTETKDVESRPSSTGIFLNWVGLGLGVLIISVGLIWYLKGRK